MRLTCTGQLYMCLGQEDDARPARRRCAPATDDAALAEAIRAAIARKPKGHDFDYSTARPSPARSRGT